MKRKIINKIKALSTATTVKIILLALPLSVLLFADIKNGIFKWRDLFETSIIFTFILAVFCEGIAEIIKKAVEKKYEDFSKLTQDYSGLVKKYARAHLEVYDNITFPIINLAFRKETEESFEIEILQKNENKRYELPILVQQNANDIMQAHKHSVLYNNMCIRLDDFIKHENHISLTYSHTMYFDSMLTNRAMDFEWKNGQTIREVYEPGPFVFPLKNSRLSNHLGFNGFVETKDNKLIFIKRDKRNSIAKRTLGTSIGASMKTQYALDNDGRWSVIGIRAAIRGEIKDELYLDIDPTVELEKTIFAFYRDVVEGGKPQFLFYYKSDKTSQEISNNFMPTMTDKNTAKVDGELIFFEKEDVLNCKVSNEYIALCENLPKNIRKLSQKEAEAYGIYSTVPSTAISLIYVKKYLQNK